jgi:hypothetical protein
MMRRVLTQVANAAVKSKGSVFQILYPKMVVRLGHRSRPNLQAVQKRANKLIKQLGSLDYQVQPVALQGTTPQAVTS